MQTAARAHNILTPCCCSVEVLLLRVYSCGLQQFLSIMEPDIAHNSRLREGTAAAQTLLSWFAGILMHSGT
jgi:hypothetical protein